jgi:ABC-type bacteriocin/lantibiotic exporter with double-glycine peptidase domain
MKPVRQLYRALFSGNGWRLFLLAVVIYLVGLNSLIMPMLFALTIDVVLPQALASHLIALVVVTLLLVLLRLFLAYYQDYEFQRLRMRSEVAALRNVSDNAIARPYQKPEGDSDVDGWLRLWLVNFQYQMTEILFFGGYALMISLTVLAVIFWVNVGAGWIAMLFLLLHCANFRVHNPRSKASSAAYSRAKAGLVGDVAATARAKRAINVALLDDRIAQTLQDKAITAFHASRDQAHIAASQGLIQSVLRGALYLLLIAYCGPSIAAGDMTTGALFMILLLVSFAFEPVYRLNQVTAMANQFLANFSPLLPFAEARQLRDGAVAGPADSPIILSGVSHSFGNVPIFAPISATLQRGQVHLLKGASGAGKTTLLDAIAGLRPASHGAILWNGTNMASHRSHIAMARQQAVIFEASLADNISLFDPAAEPGQIAATLRAVGWSNWALAEAASITADQLSLGERQRIALARALYSEAPLLLLDEPTANLDPATERICLQSIARDKGQRITVLISHSAQAMDIADVIIPVEGLYAR